MAVVSGASNCLDLSTSLELLCHLADLARKGVLPGSDEQQEELLHVIHRHLAPALLDAELFDLVSALCSYAAVGVVHAGWAQELLQQVAEQELAAPSLESYNTLQLSSLLFACGQMASPPTDTMRAYAAALAGELVRACSGWEGAPYVRAAFSSTDFANLAEACAALWGEPTAGSQSGSRSSSGSGEIGSSGSGNGSGAHEAGIPAAVTTLLEVVAGEVRTELANKTQHSARSPWTPRDLVRLARGYAALPLHGRATTQMLDALASFCVQRIRSRHLNCVSRPADLTGLLQAYADLAHNSVTVPELLQAVGDQRGLVEEAQVAVEALSGGQELDFSLLEGRWLLVYTTASDVLPLVAPPRLPSPLQIGRIYQAFTGREGSGSVQNIIEARLAGPPGFADLDAGVTLVVDAGWEARTARSIALAFREAGVQDVVLSPGLQNLLASPILPRGWWNQQLLLAIKQLSLRVPLTTRLPTAASSQALPAGLNYMLTHLDDDMLIGRAQGNGGTFIFTREAAPLKDASREAPGMPVTASSDGGGAAQAPSPTGLDVPRRTGTTLTATAHIITAVIGAGVLALPNAVAMLGWVAGPLCIVLFGVLTQICSVLLAQCYITGGKINRTYSECVAACFGRWAVVAIGVLQHVNLLLVTLAYAISAPQSLQAIARSICRQKGSTSCFDNYNTWVGGRAIIFGASQLLMVQLPNVDSLWLCSLVGATMSFGYSAIAIGMSAALAGGSPQGTLGGATFPRASDKAFQVLNAIGAILFAFNFSIQLVEIQDTIQTHRPPGPVASMRRAITFSVCIMTALYVGVACSGYAAFGNTVSSSIMTAFTSPAWLVDVANIMVVVHLGPAYQICLQPTLMFLEDKVQRWQRNPEWNRGWLLRLWFRCTVVAAVTFLACLVPFFGVIVGLSGALSFWPTTVGFPVEGFIKTHHPPAGQRLWLRALSAATVLVTLAAVVGSVQQVVASWQTFGVFKGGETGR
ncbi:Amino acid permease 2 isoform A [Micractinium conductrix]|uniref:Amino acid permease 2 isoform A n=1 Tax=Micractinium conductrix TaxID=554055 RepID=A0A2P6V5C9_9CHLO|nr:Amino acid permease 2 isoform A [Micractinium conductrix]|eukprot:PSC69282.1 Amino acid permease 2 isoform A [Micractinium conductrix]